MVATNVKGETFSLMEAEMNAIIERLNQPDSPRLSGNLVDSEGFPRTDIDIPVVRAERRHLAELRNDHKEISEKINQNIQTLHAARLGSKTSPIKVSEGDTVHVLLPEYGGTQVKLEDKEFHLFREEDILGTLHD